MKPLIVANWKCNPTTQKQARTLFGALNRGLKGAKAEVVICPPFVYLQSFKLRVSSFKLGAQNCFWENKGAFTGEVSPLMLKDLGVRYVIVGHSERRQTLRESDTIVNKKILAVLKDGLTPILCIGEAAEERWQGKTFDVLEKQLEGTLKKVPKAEINKVVIVYEPIWAISPGRPCSSDDALTAGLCIRKIISQMAGKAPGKSIRILYGGSVNSQNAASYLTSEWLQGLLVGATSLDAKEFLKTVKSVFLLNK